MKWGDGNTTIGFDGFSPISVWAEVRHNPTPWVWGQHACMRMGQGHPARMINIEDWYEMSHIMIRLHRVAT